MFGLVQSIRAVESRVFGVMLLTETKISTTAYFRNRLSYNMTFLVARMTSDGGAKGCVGIMTSERPVGWGIDSTRYHRLNVGLFRYLNSRMTQMPPLFDENQQLEDSGLVDSFANKEPRIHKAMLISQDFNPETRYLETFVEHCKLAETTDNISGAKFAASDEESDTKK